MVNHLNSTLSEPIPGKVSNVFKGKMSKKLTDALLTLKPKSANVQSKKIEQNNDEQNLKKLCRACAKAKSSLIQIFGVQGQLLNLSSLVEHLGVVHENDELPTKLCLDCVIKLRASHRFYTQFKNAEKQLRTILEFQKELGIDEEVHDDIQEIPSPPPPKKAKSTCKVSVNGSIQEVDLEKIRAEAVCRNPPVQKSTIETKQIQAELLRKDPLTKTTKIQNFEAVSTPIDLPTQELKIEKIRTVTDDEIDNSDNLNCVNSFKDETIKEFDPVSVQDPISENISELPREEIRESTNKVIPESNNVTKRHLASKYVASLKQMKLDLNNPSKIQIAEDGMMYVQVPGPNPNEMLLVKVKKAEKPIPKKTENSGKPAAAMIKAVKKQTKRKRTELIVSEESTGEDLQEELITDELPMPEEGQPPVPKIPKVRYYCDFCFKSYSNAEKLEIHAKNHEIQETYSCDDCDAYFYSPREKRLHNSNCERKLICRYCGEKFKLRAKKSQHEMKHLEAECGRLCFICGVKLKTSNVLDNHVRMVHRRFEPGVFPCPKCPKTFPLRAKLNFHVRTVHVLIRSLLCDQCGSSFKNPGSLRHHKIRKHLDINTRVECTICSKSLLKHSLSRHMLSHRGYTIKCPTCDRMFKQRSTLRQHMRIHDEKRKYKCEVCGVGFNRLDNLRKHKKAVHQKVVKPAPQRENSYRCTICNDKFANSSLLTIHRNAVHQAGQTYICHICNRQMVSSFALDWHLVCIHGQKVPGISDDGAYRLFCFHCGEQLKSEASLMKHVKSEHYEKGPVKCMDCEATFVSEGPFRHHMLSVHKRTEGTLKCPHCDHRAINQNRMKMHMIVHTDERPFSCELCSQTFKTRVQLGRHHHNMHTNHRPLQCRYCSWRSKQLSALICHERTHTNERPYNCNICGQTFKYTSDRNKHIKRHEVNGGSGFKKNPRKLKVKPEPELAEILKHESEAVEEESSSHDDLVQVEIRKVEKDGGFEVVIAANALENIESEEEETEYMEYETTQEEVKIEASEFLDRYRFYLNKDSCDEVVINTADEKTMIENAAINNVMIYEEVKIPKS